MSNRTLKLDDRLHAYLLGVSLREPPVLAALRAETATLPGANMQISPEQGQFMALLIRLLGVRRYLEVGTFTGYSALVCALAMPADGEVVALDVSAEWTAIARRYWQAAGVADRIRLELGPASRTLQGLRDSGQAGSFDFMFIDADKTGYPEYLEHGCALVRPGGLIALDNTLWSGRVADPADSEPDTLALRALNSRLQSDLRFDLAMLPVGDGLTLLRRRTADG
ncbi:MAG: class I SAM-dependent methyltransferase [Gammaproteobacteria bacterium]|nr:class I SAM-dependent methyltransferase [Gammaproteobacteria bacterium]